jgi:RimJ/RimL family protein N-acetyltransferase
MLSGKSTKLRRLKESDAAEIFPHWDRYELRQYLASPLPTSENDLVDFIKSKNENFKNRTEFYFGVESISNGELIGLINLESISWLSRHAFIGTFCIFADKERGRGYGKDALLLLLDYAFNLLDLHVVVLLVEAFNESAINFYEKIGFSNRGFMRELAYRNGKRCDVNVMDILKTEFSDKYGILPKGENVF